MFRFARVLNAARTRLRVAPRPNQSRGILSLAIAAPIVVACDSSSKPGTLVPVSVVELPEGLDLSKCHVTLYQFESCPFCRKARAVLDFAQIPYDVVEVNPLTKSETKSFANDYKKVPILVVDDLAGNRSYQVRDSKSIIRNVLRLANIATGGSNVSTPLPSTVSLNSATVFDEKAYESLSIDEAWIKWVEGYLLQLVVVNIYGTLDESRETFDYLLTHKDFGWLAREASYWAGSIVMNQVARSRLKKYTDIQNGRHKTAFFEACGDLGKSAKLGGGFIGGNKPCAADLNAYGVIRSLEGTRSLREAIQGGAGPEFKEWYQLMNDTVGVSQMQKKVNATKRGK
jgi:microsomal prostaglandin-E synthase 2